MTRGFVVFTRPAFCFDHRSSLVLLNNTMALRATWHISRAEVYSFDRYHYMYPHLSSGTNERKMKRVDVTCYPCRRQCRSTCQCGGAVCPLAPASRAISLAVLRRGLSIVYPLHMLSCFLQQLKPLARKHLLVGLLPLGCHEDANIITSHQVARRNSPEEPYFAALLTDHGTSLPGEVSCPSCSSLAFGA